MHSSYLPLSIWPC